eukprot:82939_1
MALSVLKFKQYPIWKQALLASACFTASTMLLTFGSYYYNRLKYPTLPRIDYTITGNINKNKGILVFCHGWPDFGYLWSSQIEYLSSQGYCCVNIELPNFNPDKMQNPWGYDLITVVNALGTTIQQILTDTRTQSDGVTLIAHDWGSFLIELVCLNYKNKIKFNKCNLTDHYGQCESIKCEDDFVKLNCTGNIFENNYGFPIAEKHTQHDGIQHDSWSMINTNQYELKGNQLRGFNGTKVQT